MRQLFFFPFPSPFCGYARPVYSFPLIYCAVIYSFSDLHMYEGLVESFCSAAQAQEFILVCACWESEGVCVQARAALGRKSLSTTDPDSRSHSRPSEFLTISHSTLSRRLWSINLRSPQSPLAAPVWPSLSFFWPASGVLKCFRREFRRADRNWVVGLRRSYKLK